MILSLSAFLGTLGLLLVMDHKKKAMHNWFGAYSLFMKVNLAILAAAAVAMERGLVGMERPLLYAGFLTAALVNTVWAGLIGRAARRSPNGSTGEQPPPKT